jgi:hypothetical protein
VPTSDLASHEPWLESQRRSRERRFAAMRRLRRRRGGRVAAGVLLASLTLAAGGAVAADRSGDTEGGGLAKSVRAAGSSVAALQKALGITADGIYGPITRRAVRSYQRAHGLTVDGIAGRQTLGSLGLSAGAPVQTAPTAAAPTSAPNRAHKLLARIAQCESSGNPAAVSAGGHYRGKYQFSPATWRAIGGKGDPAKASEAEQDQRALALYRAEGLAPWPVCGAS